MSDNATFEDGGTTAVCAEDGCRLPKDHPHHRFLDEP